MAQPFLSEGCVEAQHLLPCRNGALAASAPGLWRCGAGVKEAWGDFQSFLCPSCKAWGGRAQSLHKLQGLTGQSRDPVCSSRKSTIYQEPARGTASESHKVADSLPLPNLTSPKRAPEGTGHLLVIKNLETEVVLRLEFCRHEDKRLIGVGGVRDPLALRSSGGLVSWHETVVPQVRFLTWRWAVDGLGLCPWWTLLLPWSCLLCSRPSLARW